MEYSFGEKLRKLRTHRGLSQEELADNLNKKFGTSYNKGMISKWENDREEPRMEAVRNIAIYFNLDSLDDLLGLNPINIEGFSAREEKDIAADLERIMADLESREALAFHGEPMDDEDRELLRISLENSMRLAAQIAKQKFTPKKYRK
ncbi:helix-turn-helix transcriptional regulator [Paenibacillus vulneris]|uniref:Helix-turn-helix transcriptional regulator n=1 Tax=Paenibacillus vulneris TaxID=1133364 RepID=A0ABW3UX95_9BACL